MRRRASPRPELSVEGYDLTEEERTALVNGDIAAFYAAGTHPVIINGYCRAMGYKRADYRPLLEAVKHRPEEEDPMADIVMAYSASHAPMMAADRESAPREQADRFFGALQQRPRARDEIRGRGGRDDLR